MFKILVRSWTAYFRENWTRTCHQVFMKPEREVEPKPPQQDTDTTRLGATTSRFGSRRFCQILGSLFCSAKLCRDGRAGKSWQFILESTYSLMPSFQRVSKGLTLPRWTWALVVKCQLRKWHMHKPYVSWEICKRTASFVLHFFCFFCLSSGFRFLDSFGLKM